MNEEYAEKHRRLSVDDKFKFSCHKGLSCFNTCCSDVNIFLTPYDVLRMRESLEVSSGEFLKRYTVALLGDEGIPLVVLKMLEDQNKNCPFVTPDGCGIYRDRPWSCRMYPIFPASPKEDGFSIEEKSSCLALKEGKQWTIEEWKKDQGIDIYDMMNESYRQITFHDYFQKGNKLDQGKAKLIYMACYDLDDFRTFLFKTKFFDIYDVEEEVVQKKREDEEDLEEILNFGYRWVRFNLFSEGVLKLKDAEMDKLLRVKR